MSNQAIPMSDSLLHDFSDGAEAIRALQRVCGFQYNHDTIMLACLAAAREHGSNEFYASYAELGARMCSEVQPYKNCMTKEERDNRRRALQERFKRAYRSLEIDQKLTGLSFVTVECGGYRNGRNKKSLVQVDVDSVTRTIELARQSKDFATYRIRCFERAASQVRDEKPRQYIEPAVFPIGRKLRSPEARISDIKRCGSCMETYARRLYQYAVEDNLPRDRIDELKECLKQRIDICFADNFPIQLEDGKVHESVPYTNNNTGVNPCTLEETEQIENLSPRVTPNDSQDEALMNDRGADESPLDTAMLALDVVASIGASRFNVILINDAAKEKEVLTRTVATLEQVKANFSAWLERSEREQKSLVVDMKPNGQRIIQVDEANAEVMKLLAPVSFMTVETSDGNGQVWLALPEGLSDSEIADAKERLFVVLKAKGANKGASGGLRWAGTCNFKPERKRADGTYPRVRLLDYKDGRTVTTYELDALGLLSEPQPKFRPKLASKRPRAKRAPSYEYTMKCVRRKPNGEVDRSGVDVLYAVTCLNWGFSESETVDLLKEKSGKAQNRKDDYAENVVAYASKQAQLS
ncbi:MAG: hypothetical protein ICV60_02890 [Pyrinomonadaceae bacterium]|nr:hypothetical protein [Pyrinomonadaceae bacterium]